MYWCSVSVADSTCCQDGDPVFCSHILNVFLHLITLQFDVGQSVYADISTFIKLMYR